MAKNPFDDDEVDPHEAEYASVADDGDPVGEEATDEQVAASLSPEISPEASYDALDLECEKRFEVAMYYRTLLKGRLFNESTDASKVVENEARAFFKERLEALLGIRAPKPTVVEQVLPFDKEEIAALKAVARRLVAKPELIEAKPAQPKLRQASVPTSPSRTVQETMPRVAPLQKTGPTPAQIHTFKAPPRPVNPDREVVVEDTGKIIKKGNKTFRVVKNDLGTEFKQDLTTQGNPPGRIAMPSGAMLGQVTEIQSAHQISKLDIQVNGHHVGTQQLAAKVSQE